MASATVPVGSRTQAYQQAIEGVVPADTVRP
jgi:hypothetical protein